MQQDEMMQELRELRERLDRAESRLERLAATPAPRPTTPPTDPSVGDDRSAPTSATAEPPDRRRLLKQAGLVAGAAAAGVAATVASASPAAAANGSPVTLGVTTNSATAATRSYNPTTEDAHLFEFSDTNAGSGSLTSQASLAGYASAIPVGTLGVARSVDSAGVVGYSDGTGGFGMVAQGLGTNGVGIRASGTQAAVSTLMSVGSDNAGVDIIGGRRGVRTGTTLYPLSLGPYNGLTGPPPYAAIVGDTFVDQEGTLFYCVAAGTPGRWTTIGGPGTAGAFTAIDPTRVYDSRRGGGGPLAANQSRVCSVANGINPANGTVTVPGLVPSGATAIQYNLTIVNTVGTGYLQVSPGDAAGITGSSINWTSSNQTIANGLSVRLDGSRQVKAFAAVGTTDFIIDVLGYYR